MTEKSEKFLAELKALISDGNKLLWAIQYECHPKEFKDQVANDFDNDEAEIETFMGNMVSFRDKYQSWYSAAHAVVKQVLPDRLADFTSHYEYTRARKSITFDNYMIRDYLQGLQVTRGDGQVVVNGAAAIPEFNQQLNIVKAAKVNLNSTLMDLKAILQADLFDTEIEAAGSLAKAGYLRAAGAICGVIIEKHLSHTCESHNLKVPKKNPGISDLSQLLRSSNVITLAQERYIQSLADTRNICSHAKGREPTKEEITDLLEGTGKTLKTIF